MDAAGLLQDGGRPRQRRVGEGAPEDCRLLTPAASALEIPPANIFFANAEGKGYYRSTYAPKQYAALVDRVESGLTPTERISLSGDEWAAV